VGLSGKARSLRRTGNEEGILQLQLVGPGGIDYVNPAGLAPGRALFTLLENDPKRRRPDISRAQELLNWKPYTALKEGLVSTIAYFERLLREHYEPSSKVRRRRSTMVTSSTLAPEPPIVCVPQDQRGAARLVPSEPEGTA